MSTINEQRNQKQRVQAAQTQMKKRRVIYEKGRAYTSADIDLPDWNFQDFINPEYKDKVTYWYPGAKRKSAQAGDSFVFRLLPALSTQIEGEDDGSEQYADWVPGRDVGAHGKLHHAVFRQIPVIESFGSNKQVSFIPTTPYDGPDAPPYSSLKNNPYQILCDVLFSMKGAGIDHNWLPLVMSKKETDAYREKQGLHNKMFSASMLPVRQSRFFAYAWIYRGYNTDAKKDFYFRDKPYGSNPKHGLQIISISQSSFDALQSEYRRTLRKVNARDQNKFQYSDPASFNEGALNYIWLAKTANPITGDTGSSNVMGYTAAVSDEYYQSPDNAINVNLTVDSDFEEWYYEAWQPWDVVLKGTYGEDQVMTIGQYFPELKWVCKQVWSGHRDLMAAWEKAFESSRVDADYDFHDILHRRYGVATDSSVAGDNTRLNPEDYTTSTRRPQAGSRMNQAFAKNRQKPRLEEENFEYDSDLEPQDVKRERPVRNRPKPAKETESTGELRRASRPKPKTTISAFLSEPLSQDDEDGEVEERKTSRGNILQKVGERVRKPQPRTEVPVESYNEREEMPYDEEDFDDEGDIGDTDEYETDEAYVENDEPW